MDCILWIHNCQELDKHYGCLTLTLNIMDDDDNEINNMMGEEHEPENSSGLGESREMMDATPDDSAMRVGIPELTAAIP